MQHSWEATGNVKYQRPTAEEGTESWELKWTRLVTVISRLVILLGHSLWAFKVRSAIEKMWHSYLEVMESVGKEVCRLCANTVSIIIHEFMSRKLDPRTNYLWISRDDYDFLILSFDEVKMWLYFPSLWLNISEQSYHFTDLMFPHW